MTYCIIFVDDFLLKLFDGLICLVFCFTKMPILSQGLRSASYLPQSSDCLLSLARMTVCYSFIIFILVSDNSAGSRRPVCVHPDCVQPEAASDILLDNFCAADFGLLIARF